MPLPTTRLQAERLATRLTSNLEDVDGEYRVGVLEPTRGDFVVTVSVPADEGEAGISFHPSELDNGAHGITNLALARIYRLTDPEYRDPTEIVVQGDPEVFDVMTTENTALVDLAVVARAALALMPVAITGDITIVPPVDPDGALGGDALVVETPAKPKRTRKPKVVTDDPIVATDESGDDESTDSMDSTDENDVVEGEDDQSPE